MVFLRVLYDADVTNSLGNQTIMNANARQNASVANAPPLYFAIIGRKAGDLVDTCHFAESRSKELALEQFKAAISSAPTATGLAAELQISAILCSETPISESDINLQALTQLQDPRLLETIIAAADQHGQDSEPEHQVGDLEDVARAMWKMLTPSQKVGLLNSREVESILETVRGSEFSATLDEVHSDEIAQALQAFSLDPSLPYPAQIKLAAVNHYRLLPESAPRYAYSEGWGHIFQGDKETTTRWARDTTDGSLVDAQFLSARGWQPLDAASANDLLEDIKDNESLGDLGDLDVRFAADAGDLPDWVNATPEQNHVRDRTERQG